MSYTPHQRDQDDIARRQVNRSAWWAIVVPFILIAAFVTSPFMGFAMLGTMLLLSFKK